eukprot:CCRYP_010463-RA/>CCRYP_010463-RA protein AED:0.02 eAED:0.02 QI:200/1/1/1/0/0.5/2/1036/420
MMNGISSLLDIEDDGDNSCCSSFTATTVHNCGSSSEDDEHSSFTVATVLENDMSKNKGLVRKDVYYHHASKAGQIDASTQRGNSSNVSSRIRRNRNTMLIDRNEEIQKLRCTSSLIDSSLDSTCDENSCEGVEQMIPPVTSWNARNVLERNTNMEVQKTIKKSNRKSSNFNSTSEAINRHSVFRKMSAGDKSVKSSISTRLHMKPVKSPLLVPYDEKLSPCSFDASASTQTNLLDLELDNVDVGAAIRQRKRHRTDAQYSNKFLSVYDELDAQAIDKSSSFDSQSGVTYNKRSKAKMKSMAPNAVLSITRGNCEGVGSWDRREKQTSSEKKRLLHQTDTPKDKQNLGQSWSSKQYPIQWQSCAERDKERQLFNQKLQECNTQINFSNTKTYQPMSLSVLLEQNRLRQKIQRKKSKPSLKY